MATVGLLNNNRYYKQQQHSGLHLPIVVKTFPLNYIMRQIEIFSCVLTTNYIKSMQRNNKKENKILPEML